MKQLDFVIPYILGPNDGLELKLALRSIEKNFQHDNYRIIVIGEKPTWLTKVKHIEFSRIPEQNGRNFTDQLLKLYTVLTELDVNPNFVWTYDDIYFTSTVKLADLKELKAVASFEKRPDHLENSGAGPNWKRTLKYTMQQVLENGGSNFNYETHLPRYFSKSRVIKLIDKFNLLGKPMMISSLYYNYFHKNQVPSCLLDKNKGVRFLLRSMLDVVTLRKELPKHLFTNNSPNTWTTVFQKVLAEMFPAKSKYEL